MHADWRGSGDPPHFGRRCAASWLEHFSEFSTTFPELKFTASQELHADSILLSSFNLDIETMVFISSVEATFFCDGPMCPARTLEHRFGVDRLPHDRRKPLIGGSTLVIQFAWMRGSGIHDTCFCNLPPNIDRQTFSNDEDTNALHGSVSPARGHRKSESPRTKASHV